MNWVVVLPLLIRGLTAIQPLLSGLDSNKVSIAGNNLVPVLETLIGRFAPGSEMKVGPAIVAATAVFDPNPTKWIQQILNVALGGGIQVDGLLGPQTLSAVDSFAQKELGVLPGGVASELVRSLVKWFASIDTNVSS
jgi:Predicted Peptidoglycan domain